MRKETNKSIWVSLFISLFVFGMILETIKPSVGFADTAAEIQSNIDSTNNRILELQKEIDKYSTLLESNSKQANSLKNELSRLETTRKKLGSDLLLTQSKIKKTNLTLEELSDTIVETEIKISNSNKAVAQSIRNMQLEEDQSIVQQFLNRQSLSEAWDYVSSVRSVQSKLSTSLNNLISSKTSLESKQTTAQKERINLINLQKNLSGQKEVVENNKDEQTKLLASTNNSASVYQSQLQAKIAAKEKFEDELFQFESQLKLTVDPNSIPDKKSGILSWPLSKIIITQKFGKTSFSGRLYASGTHGGVDFGIPTGTPVKSVLSGTIEATGNTDIEKGCYSYGKWILVRHSNGLSSIYGHLSVISVQKGDEVSRGEVIGYSGNTGYSTGPHLHLGLFATQGVQVQVYSTSRYCKNTVIPMADVKAYLDPLAYLPVL